jgi:hypothetical protein
MKGASQPQCNRLCISYGSNSRYVCVLCVGRGAGMIFVFVYVWCVPVSVPMSVPVCVSVCEDVCVCVSVFQCVNMNSTDSDINSCAGSPGRNCTAFCRALYRPAAGLAAVTPGAQCRQRNFSPASAQLSGSRFSFWVSVHA